MKFISILFITVFIGLNSVYAQTYPFRTYSIEEGLSESVVYDIIQDSDGFIWLATGFGLNKFDGYSFETFFEDHGLLSSQTNTIFEASDGGIWVGTDNGAQVIYGDSVHTYPDLRGLESHSVISIYQDSNGEFWFGTEGSGVWHYFGDGSLEVYTTNNGLAGNQVRAITETIDGSLWFATRSGVSRLSNGNFRSYTQANGLPENRIRDIKVDPIDPNKLWVATRNGLAHFDGESFSAINGTSELVDQKVRAITFGENNDIWLATEGGISLYRNNSFTNFGTEEGLSANIVYSAMSDREGNIWFGTLGGGASLLLGQYFENFDTESGLPNNLVTSFTEDANGTMWIGSYGGGLVSFDGSEFEYFYTQHGLPDNRVYHLSTDSKGRTWVGMRDGLAFIQNGEMYEFSEQEFPFRKVRHVNETTAGTYWISTYDEGLIHLKDDGFEQFTSEDGLPNNTVLVTAEDEEGNLWIATYGGVAKKTSDGFELYSLQDGLPNNGIMDLIVDESGTVWIASFGGIAWFDGVQFIEITDADGLPGRVCYFIEQDSNGIYWVGTNAGLARLDIDKYYSNDEVEQNQAIQILQSDQGLIANEANLGAVYEDADKNLWIGTVDGVSKFYPEEYRGNQVPPRVKITDFRASGRSFQSNDITLDYDRDFIQIDFSAINFTAPNLVTYRYRMSNIDPEWQYTTERTARYPSLPSGKYTFEVQAQNSSGVWSFNTATIDFSLNPPFWFTWWFVSIIVIVIAGILYLFYRNYQYMQMVDIERMRVRIASDLHDDVGASLTEVALQSDFLQASSMDSEFKNSLTQIGQQCRKIVTSLDDIVWSIDARNDTLGDLTDRMQDYILNVLEPLNFEVHYNFDDLKMEEKIPVPVKENLYLIFKEAINNIAKYSNGDKVDIGMKSNGSSFTFVIHDNGTTGKGAKKTGQGLRNMQMRAQRMNGSVDITQNDGFRIELKGKLTLN
ncbi:MAG: hypothetical protein JJ895_15460 [Balneolaceae bacterium]|nr:hypothetical protein [Balneolaceae bacterium]